jgi:cytochrome c oxidase assembly protein subunit 15
VKTARLARVTLILTLFLIGFGGFTRGSLSGYGCEDRWPLCKDGLLGGWLPRPEFHMIVEWTHRWLAAWVGLFALLLFLSAWKSRRERLAPVILSASALVVIFIQAWIGRAVVKNDLDADLVSLHLLISLTVAFLITSVIVTSSPRDARPGPGKWRTLVVSAAGSSLVVLFLGSLVHNQYYPGWPLMKVGLMPGFGSIYANIHWFHRVGAGLLLIGLFGLVRHAKTTGRPPASIRMVSWAAWLYTANVLAGWLHVLTKVSSSLVVATHLSLAAVVAVLLVWEFLRSVGQPDPTHL